MTTTPASSAATSLVIGGTGKVGSRVALRLAAAGHPVRVGSRAASPAFSWEDRASWPSVLAGVDTAFVSFYPDISFPGAERLLASLAEDAVRTGVRRVVLLSGRGEPEAEPAERAVQRPDLEWTVLRCSWFDQNFSEHFLLQPVLDGVIALPAGDVTEPFVDIEDVAEVAVRAMTGPDLGGRVLDLTGPELLGMADVAAVLSQATGRPIAYAAVTPEEYAAGAAAAGVPEEEIAPLTDLFTRVLDGHNASVTTGIPDVLGRPAATFADYARRTAASGIWDVPSATGEVA